MQIGLPHNEDKQEYGEVLNIIGFRVNLNDMTITMPPEAKTDLILYLDKFVHNAHGSKRHELREFQRLAGWVNWSFNVYPLLRPGLCNIYAKIAGKDKPKAQVFVNKAVRDDIYWLIKHLKSSTGIYVHKHITWAAADADLVMFCDACLEGLAFYIPQHKLGFYSAVPDNLPPSLPVGSIFFPEALAVLSALAWASSLAQVPGRLTIYTDNQNTVDIFNSLRATPVYNSVLKMSVDLRIAYDIDLQVLHIPGERNVIADAISRKLFAKSQSLIHGLVISTFIPPQQVLGAVKK